MAPPCILFVHGAAADARLWRPVIAFLPATWSASALTLTYFGDTVWPDRGEQFGTKLHAREVGGMAKSLGGDVHLVCWSYSVHVGLQALLDAPGLFASALFYEAGLGQYLTDETEIETFGQDAGACFGAVGAKLEHEGTEAAVRQLIGSDFAQLAPERQAMYLSNAAMMPLLMGGGQPPTKIGPDALCRIETPCRVVMGSETRPCFALPSRALAKGLPNGTLEVLPKAGHFLPETAPELFAALVEEWIDILGKDDGE